MIYLVSTIAFIAGFAFVAGINFLIADLAEERRKKSAAKAKEDARLRNAEKARRDFDTKLAHQRVVAQLAQHSSDGTLWSKWKLLVLQSGVSGVKPEGLLILVVGLGCFVGASIGYLTRSVLFGIPSGLIASVFPIFYILWKRNSRQRKLLSQLPDAYEMLSRTLRSGQTVSQGIRTIADEFESPLAEEFAYCWDQQNLGLSPDASLKELAKRVGLLEINVFVVALTINATAGGNLANLLAKLSNVIRERQKMREKTIALTTEGRLQAYFLIAMPIALALILGITNPGYLRPLLDNKPLLFGTVAWVALGFFWMQRIMNFEV